MGERTFTYNEAAKALCCSRRWLQIFLARLPVDDVGNPFYVPIGNRKTFTENDIERIRATLREEERCRLSSSRRALASRRTGTRAVGTSESSLIEARRLLSEWRKSRKKRGE